ncbi:hypothetical protein ACIBJF_20220 [Streptomyces sp. NPDC050743]|uniref:hypothetical protein n=1 Tax=Streptomyces sp. NPDC050743 TaxID=3365634 RepID=UPI0037A73FD7
MTHHTHHRPDPPPRRRHPADEAIVLADRVLEYGPRQTLRERYGLPRPAKQHTAALV